MESNTEHSNNMFQFVDAMFTHYLGGCDSVIELDEYTVTISNVAYQEKENSQVREKFMISFVRVGESHGWNGNLYKGMYTIHDNGNVHREQRSFYETTPNGTKMYNSISSEEMEQAFLKLRRKYNLDAILD
jgi:hypothetical protein